MIGSILYRAQKEEMRSINNNSNVLQTCLTDNAENEQHDGKYAYLVF